VQVTTKGRYAMLAVVDIALHEDHGPVSRKDIAARQQLPNDYVEQILVRLRRANVIASTRGPHGGYRLARSATEITALDVLNAAEEHIEPATCVGDLASTCSRSGTCASHLLWDELTTRVSEYLRSVTLAMLLERYRVLERGQRPLSFA
jgi:Rrf2 family iron-sulfur cluster assembly transcriptional regulator